MLNVRFQSSTPEFWRKVEEIEEQSSGTISFSALNIATGEKLERNPEMMCRTASIIKLPVLVHAAFLVNEGKRDWKDMISLKSEDKVGGSGVLKQMSDGSQYSLLDLCTLMMIISDNTATNMVLDYISLQGVNERMHSLGLEHTRIFRKAFTPETPESMLYGLGVTTASEMQKLLAQILAKQLCTAETSELILKILASQQIRDCIPRYLPPYWKYAGKTGAIDSSRNDIGVVTSQSGDNFILSLFCQNMTDVMWTPDNSGEVALAKLSAEILGVTKEHFL